MRVRVHEGLVPVLVGNRDRDDVVKPARLGTRKLEGNPPRLRVDLGASGVRGSARSHQRTGVGITDHDLA